ncbi:ankyrin [Trichoderma virens Gv29-8]|uniref:Ankyrin n=1 Tax=Hypocrea virens (strain Gv29-8 / FGSC 10586) TaxID=413071 RepID=G9MQF3_HYPVG|nr:ankyrin [Trichoderma virens Gv29-8]EHK24074.1 ankyrin [Trichoderma virens Gv29-8]
MPRSKLPFRSSSVKAMGSNLFSRNRREDAQKDLTKQSGEPRRRRASISAGERPTPEFQRPTVAKEFRSHQEVQRPTMPPPSASSSRVRSPPRRESLSRGSVSPHSRQRMPGSGDGHHSRQSRSPPRRRYSSSEIPRPRDMTHQPQSPVPSRSQRSESHERRDRHGYGGAAATGVPPSSPHLAPKSEWNASSREARQEARRYPPSASANNRPQPAKRGSSPYHRPSAASDRHRSASVDGYDRNSHSQHSSAQQPISPSRRPKHERRGSDSFFNKFPTSFATYAGIRALSEHADKAKEWVEWFNNVNDAPDEIRALSTRISTTRDTIQQMKECLEARPDLIEDETGQVLKSHIEDAIDSTSETLKKMTKLLASFSGAAKQDSTALGRLEGFWHSYNYKNEGEEQIKAADAELQQQLLQLGTLMSNIYASVSSLLSRCLAILTSSSRALKRPSPGIATPNAPTPPQSSARLNPTIDASIPMQQPAASIPNRPPPSPQLSPKSKGHFETTGIPPKVVPNPPTPPRSEPSVEQPPSHGSANASTAGLDSHNTNPPPNPKDVLLDAAWEGDVKTVANCLRQAPPDSCDPHGLTPLHLAVECDHMAVAMYLLDHGADVHARADGGCMPLHLAARYASAATVEMLIERGKADPNCQTTDGRTPLHYAARSAEDGEAERREVIRALRDLGANPTIRNRRGELARDVAQKRNYWDAAATLSRAEHKWEQQQQQKQRDQIQQQQQQQQQQQHLQKQQQREEQQREQKYQQQLRETTTRNTRESNPPKKEGSWLQRYRLKK